MKRLAAMFCAALVGLYAAPPAVREPAVAGTFYPAGSKELAGMVDGFLARASAPRLDVVALVAPHAGYPYSGPVAAYSYALLRGRKVARVVVIAPTHAEAFSFASVYDGDAYTTPLGQVPVDREFAARLAKQSSAIRLSKLGHSPREHAVEVQLPFLQRTLEEFKLVPIVMGDQSYENCRAVGLALARLIQGQDTLIVASSDLSHYHAYEAAVRLDHKTLHAIEEWDYLNMARNFERNVWEACGGGPIVAAMIAAERLGATEARVLKYANSGDTTDERSRVVGYGAVALLKGAPRRAAAAFTLAPEDRRQLLEIARKSVEMAVKERRLYPLPPVSQALGQERGAFVTLKEKGELRGCIGYVTPAKSLAETVRDVAAYAAVEDRRFPPVLPAELEQIQFEISVLSPLKRVLDTREIQVGRDGLIMHQGDKEGLLLPQVPVEQHWDRGTFLRETCLKAALPARAWQDKDTDIFSFTALVFGDKPTAPASSKAR